VSKKLQVRVLQNVTTSGKCTILNRSQYPRHTFYEGDYLRLIACLLLLSGFFIALAALVLMPSLHARLGFVAAGIGVEVLGVALLTQAHKSAKKEQR
jgi:hypothetical protein